MYEHEQELISCTLEKYRLELQNPKLVDTFNMLFENITTIHKIENNYIYLIVDDPLAKFKVEKFYLIRLNEILKDFSNNSYGLKFILAEDAKKDLQKVSPSITKDTIDPARTKRLLRSEFTFENFVVGESNRFAYSQAMQVANSHIAIFNPLYIMGSVGLGKTHLMMAIGHYILDNNINANVIYTSATQFTDDYFRALSAKKTEDINKFNDYYQSADILLVDDIQFLEGKEKTQEQFFKCFDYLHEQNKQIVITADRPANELKIMDRLRSRFSWGELVEIKTPDLELRIDILRRKLNFLISNPKDVPDEVLEELASLFRNNVRELEGGLRTYINYCVSFGYSFTKDHILEAVGSHLPKNDITAESGIAKKLKNIVCNYFRISNEDLESESRKSTLVYARNLAFYILRNDYQFQLGQIGSLFGGRDHTTIAHGCDKIKTDLESNSAVIADIKHIKKKMMEK